MQVRTAASEDSPAIRDVARRSLQASYSLGPQAITTAVSGWYDEDALDETIDDDDRLVLVAERDGQVVGFAESERSGDGGTATLLWLHVDPAYRGRGVASALFDRTHDRLTASGVDRVAGRVLEDNADGNEFYEAQGFERVGRDEVEIAGETRVENVYAEGEAGGLQSIRASDGDTVYVDESDWDEGSSGKFYAVYADEDATEHYGYFCANCNRLANAMDAMGRIECDSCGNARKATRWDAAYL
ncbi:GNAT family N-acetyltransferase [Halosimplex aquaticum]|uniref:GNAT family N-acetyltransferase n=1 Tax=Halosimplex aquaticum TaxID=3026162 RepID=A0ABD5Y9B7_9EURY|nr:GNAT family N-acetyltransferase [Halosimplex aquaticum]